MSDLLREDAPLSTDQRQACIQALPPEWHDCRAKYCAFFQLEPQQDAGVMIDKLYERHLQRWFTEERLTGKPYDLIRQIFLSIRDRLAAAFVKDFQLQAVTAVKHVRERLSDYPRFPPSLSIRRADRTHNPDTNRGRQRTIKRGSKGRWHR